MIDAKSKILTGQEYHSNGIKDIEIRTDSNYVYIHQDGETIAVPLELAYEFIDDFTVIAAIEVDMKK